MSRRAGLVVRRAGARYFLPAALARSVVAAPRVTRVPWSRLCMALVAGQVVCVLELAPPTSTLVMCEVAGRVLGLAGLVVDEVGWFEGDASGVLVLGERVSELVPARVLGELGVAELFASGATEAP